MFYIYIYMHVSTVIKQNSITRVYNTLFKQKSLHTFPVICLRSKSPYSQAALTAALPYQKDRVTVSRIIFINGYLKNERLLVNSASTTGIAMPNMVGNDIQSH